MLVTPRADLGGFTHSFYIKSKVPRAARQRRADLDSRVHHGRVAVPAAGPSAGCHEDVSPEVGQAGRSVEADQPGRAHLHRAGADLLVSLLLIDRVFSYIVGERHILLCAVSE